MRDALLRVRRHRLGTDERACDDNVRTRCCTSADTGTARTSVHEKPT
jgi:hypothetical protein